MEYNSLTWMCNELGLAALTELEDGAVAANAAAQAAGCPATLRSLEQGIARLTAISPRDPRLVMALTQARSGEPSSLSLQDDDHGIKLILAPIDGGRLVASVSPRSRIVSETRANTAMADAAAAVSHEVANAVGAIGGWATLASEKAASGLPVGEALRLIASSACTAQEAAQRLLCLARGDQVEPPGPIELSSLVKEFCELLTVTARDARVHLRAQIEPQLWVTGSRAELFTIVWNLTKNAIEACPAGGAVTVRLQASSADVELEVRDTGAGFAPEARVFDAYFTTKQGGTGLGLALVQQAVQALEGQVAVQSAPGDGTVFRVRLPRLSGAGASRARCLAHGTSSGAPRLTHGTSGGPCLTHDTSGAPCLTAGDDAGSPPRPLHDAVPSLDASVLVVDDDCALREMVATALSLRGARVTAVSSSQQAKEIEGGYDIALIDMMLDDCRGDELLATLRRRGTVSAAMLVTGSVKKPRLVPGGEPDDWVRKPFELSTLIDRIQGTLERHKMLHLAASMPR